MKTHQHTLHLAIVATLFAGTSFAQAPREFPEPPPPAAPREANISAPRELTLPSGLRVVVAERKGLPLITAQLLVLAGAEADSKGMAGLAEMTSSLLTKGTRAGDGVAAMSATQIAQAAEALGGTLSTGAGWHRSGVDITVTTPKLDDALRLMAACVTRPAFPNEELNRLRAQAIDGLSVALADPGRLAAFASSRAVFGENPYGNMAGGSPASLKRLSIGEVQRFHQQHYQPGNAVLIFAGDVSLDAATTLVQKHFGRWKARGDAKATSASKPVSANTGAPIVIDMPDAGQASVTVSWLSVPFGAKDYYAGLVSNAVLGGGYSSRLNQEIRIKRGLSYGANSRFDARLNAGLQRASAQTKNESAVEVMQLMEAELTKLASTPPSANEMNARTATLIGGFSRSLETTGGLAGEIAANIAGGAPASAITQHIGKISAISAEDASAFMKTYAAPERQRIVIAGDIRKFGEALRNTKSNAQVILAKAIDLDAADLKGK
jgi:zinc protease